MFKRPFKAASNALRPALRPAPHPAPAGAGPADLPGLPAKLRFACRQRRSFGTPGLRIPLPRGEGPRVRALALALLLASGIWQPAQAASPHCGAVAVQTGANLDVVANAALADLDGCMNGWYVVAMADANRNLVTTVDADGHAVALRNRALEATGALTAARDIVLPDAPKVYYVWNNTTGGFAVNVKTVTDTTGVAVAAGEKVVLLVEAASFDVRSWTPSVALALGDLTNVDEAGKQDGDALVYNSGSGDWEPGAVDTGLPPGYVTGFGLANNATDAEHDLDIGAGAARDGGDTVDAVLAGTLIKQIDAAWSEGSNAGGLFTGTVAASTWYHLVLIREDASGDVDAGFDTDPGGASKPVGWTVMRRLGAVLTDGLANIRGFQHLAEHGLFLWNDPILEKFAPPSVETSIANGVHMCSVSW